MANVIFKQGTLAQYNALANKNANTLYWLHDVRQLYKGEVLYAVGAEATSLASGLMSAADKAKLDALGEGGVLALTPVDSTIVIADGDGGKTIGVRVSAGEGNVLAVRDDGLFVPAVAISGSVEFSLEKQGVATEGYSVTYKLKRTEGENVTYVGDEINIPKDMVLQSGTLEVVVEANQPYEGAEVNDSYLDLVLNDEAGTHIYIPVRDIMTPYVGGKGIKIDNGIISVQVDTAKANGLVVGVAGLGLNEATPTVSGAMSAADKEALDTAVNDIADIKNSIVWGTMESEEPIA